MVVVCGYTDAARSLTDYTVHATAPFESPPGDDEIVSIDLDLDFEIVGDDAELHDEGQFHDRARSMGYPSRIVRGAWSGISTIAASYTNGDWPSTDRCRSGWTAPSRSDPCCRGARGPWSAVLSRATSRVTTNYSTMKRTFMPIRLSRQQQLVARPEPCPPRCGSCHPRRSSCTASA